MINRLAKNLVDIDGLKVIFDEERKEWVALNGTRLSLIQLQNLYLFMNEEVLFWRKRFDKYVDDVIQKLIYTKNEHN